MITLCLNRKNNEFVGEFVNHALLENSDSITNVDFLNGKRNIIYI